MTRPLKRWTGLFFYTGTAPLPPNGDPQKHSYIVAHTKKEAVEILSVQGRASMHYFNEYWAASVESTECTEIGLWANDVTDLYRGSPNWVQIVDESKLLAQKAKETRYRQEHEVRVAKWDAENRERADAKQRSHLANEELIAAALNMHIEFPKGAEAREDAYIRIHEAVIEYEQIGGKA